MAGWQTLFGTRGFAFLAAAALAFSGVVVGSQYAFYEDAPTLEPGETWVYEQRTKFTGYIPQWDWDPDNPEDGEMRMERVSQEDTSEVTMRVMDANATVGDVAAYALRIRSDDTGLGETIHLTRENLNPVWTEDGKPFELMLFQFPLRAGKTWTQTIDNETTLTYTVANRDLLETPYGSLEAFRIEAAPQLAQTAGNATGDEDVTVTTSFAYWYAPSVRFLGAVEILIDVADRETGDTLYHFEHTLRLAEHHVLTAASLPDVHLQIDGPAEVNTATGGRAAYEARAGGLPEDGVLKWFVNGHDAGEGEKASVEWTDPGVRHLEVEAYDADGNYLGYAEKTVEAYWLHEERGRLHAFDHETWELPVHPGARLVRASLQIDGTPVGGALGDYAFQLLDSDEEPVAEGEEMEVRNPDRFDLGTWVADLETRGIPDLSARYTLSLEVRYAPEAAEGPMETVEPDEPENPFRAFLQGPRGALTHL